MKTEVNSLQQTIENVNDITKAQDLHSHEAVAKPLSGLSRVLTEADLESAGVRKLLLGQMDEFDNCKSKLQKTETDFHAEDKESAVLSETLKNYKSFDFTYTGLLSVGSILIGFYAAQPDKGSLLLWLGIASVIVALFIKYKRSL